MTVDDLDGPDPWAGLDDDDVTEFGQPRPGPRRTRPEWDGDLTIAARRPELLNLDDQVAWWNDLKTWTFWMVRTFRQERRIPPCWPQHPAIVEELMALWLFWQACWLPGDDPSRPAGWLQQLDLSLSRIDRLWKLPCTPQEHQEPTPAAAGADGTPGLHRWWSNDTYLQERTRS